MKIELEINEEKILELAKTASLDELPRNIFYEAKRQAVEIAVKELKDKLTEKSYFGDKEFLRNEVRDEIYKQIDATVKKYVEERFSEKSIEQKVSFYADRCFESWIQKRVFEELEKAKKDIQFYSEKEVRENQEE